jgi:hypothetical protein
MDLTLMIFVSGLIFGGACSILAANKHRDPLGWFALGFFFSLVALIVIAALSPMVTTPSEDQRRKRRGNENGFASSPADPERPWLG